MMIRIFASILVLLLGAGLVRATTLDETVLDLYARAFPPPSDDGRPLEFGGVPGLWVATHGARVATLLYLHGGGYWQGSPQDNLPVLKAFARRGFDVFAPAYRLAPAFPFPAAVEDVKAAYMALRRDAPGKIVVVGGSSGGGLALALLVDLRDGGEPLPSAAALFSPWIDLSLKSASIRDHLPPDLTMQKLEDATRWYLAGTSPATPLASPLYADLRGLPPILIHVGAEEFLRDDSTRFVERARDFGVLVRLEMFHGVPHGWQLLVNSPDARRSIETAAAFLSASAGESWPILDSSW